MIKTKKIRLYITDQIVPSTARTVRMVIDLFTDESILKFPTEKGKIEDLTIFGVNRDWELPFLEEDGYLLINLGNLDQWIGIEDSNGMKHIKLDMSFVLVEPEFKRDSLNRGYVGYFEFSEYEELELHITLPLGMKMHREKGNPEICLLKEGKENNIMKIPASNILDKDRKRRYDFLLDKNSFKELYDESSHHEMIKLEYKAVNENEYYVITVIGLGVFVFALLRMIDLSDGQIKFDIRYLAAAVAFISLYITILREKYEIPFRKVLVFTTVFIGIELILELLMEG